MKILIGDDETEICKRLAQFLRSLGHECITALSVQEAIEAFVKDRPALAIVDYCFPVSDGFELIARIKEISPATPVIMMTAYDAAGREAEARRLGAAAYLRKPFALGDLTAAIETAGISAT